MKETHNEQCIHISTRTVGKQGLDVYLATVSNTCE